MSNGETVQLHHFTFIVNVNVAFSLPRQIDRQLSMLLYYALSRTIVILL